MTAASASDAAGCRSSINDDTAAGSLGSEEVISSQPAVCLSNASKASQPMAGQAGSSPRPPNTSPNASVAIVALAVASATGPATWAEPPDDRRITSRQPA